MLCSDVFDAIAMCHAEAEDENPDVLAGSHNTWLVVWCAIHAVVRARGCELLYYTDICSSIACSTTVLHASVICRVKIALGATNWSWSWMSQYDTTISSDIFIGI